jgi:hypothetical protein
MSWRTYGKIGLKITAGLIVGSSAVVFIGKHIRGQHLAEPLAGFIERDRIYDLEDTDTPDESYEHLSQHIRWNQFYGCLTDSRTMATNVISTSNLDLLVWEWRDITNNSDIANCESVWTNTTAVKGSVKYYSVEWDPDPDSVTNIYEKTPVTASLVDDGDTILDTRITAPRMPLAKALYGNYQIATNATLWNGSNNWWRIIGIDNNYVYKYACEDWGTNATETITVTSLALFPEFTITPSTIEVQEDKKRTVTATSINSDANTLKAMAYKLEAPDRQTAYYAVSDLGTPGSLTLTRKTIDTSESTATELLGVKLTADPLGTVNVNVGFVGTGFTIAGAPFNLTFDSGNYSTYQYVTNVIVPTSSTADQCGFVGVRNSADSISHFVAVRVADTNGVNNDIVVSDTLQTVAKQGSDTFTVNMGTGVVSEVVETVSQFIRTNNLNQVYTVLQNLDDTIAIIDYSELTYTNEIRRNYGSTSNANYSGSATQYDVTQCVTIANTLLQVNDGTNTAGAANELFAIDCNASVEGYENGTDTSSRFVEADMYFRDLKGCRLTYPSHWAITNGYINSYSVYGLMVCQHGSRMRGGKYSEIDGLPEPQTYTNLISYIDDSTQPDKYESYLFGICDAVRLRPDVTIGTDTVLQTQAAGNTNTYNAVFRSRADYYDIDLEYVDSPLTLLATVSCTNATTVPYFDITTAYTNIQLALSDYQQHYMDLQRAGGTYDYNLIKFDTAIAIQKFVVVVDWDWEYVGQAYNPTNYTPEWVTTNTP